MLKPLHGKSILVPRAKKQATELSATIKQLGGAPVEIPLLAFRSLPLASNMQAKLKEGVYDWLVFTSSNGVNAFFSTMELKDSLYKIAVIGDKTAETLAKYGHKAAFIPSSFVAETFAQEFAKEVAKNEQVLIIKGSLARNVLYKSLCAAGIAAEEAIIYETYFPKESETLLVEALKKRSLDVLLFTSSSTVEYFMDVVHTYNLYDYIKDCIIGCIGPITKKKLADNGINVHIFPDNFTVDSMLEQLVQYLTE
ncbi:uroporphyrinogen-III synthase [Niallia taxi]|uniref:uroporphyrinogen-III synthase n=1 Tax=Niallia TaxID=2837506 RepID=UPI002040BB1A|nr:uroporphyrinogen-III synthase [Niallia sp. MER 6]MCM3029954.1 uroporphyrinogen-III synthase [Niallia sp. MER 6]